LVEQWLEAEHLAKYALKTEFALITIAFSLGRNLLFFVTKFVKEGVAFRSLKHFIGIECFLDNILLLKAVFGCAQ
jgi:hypothetical protein